MCLTCTAFASRVLPVREVLRAVRPLEASHRSWNISRIMQEIYDFFQGILASSSPATSLKSNSCFFLYIYFGIALTHAESSATTCHLAKQQA